MDSAANAFAHSENLDSRDVGIYLALPRETWIFLCSVMNYFALWLGRQALSGCRLVGSF